MFYVLLTRSLAHLCAESVESWVNRDTKSDRRSASEGTADATVQNPVPQPPHFEPLPVMPETDLTPVQRTGQQVVSGQTAPSAPLGVKGRAGATRKNAGIPVHQVSAERQSSAARKRGAESAGSNTTPILRLKAYASEAGSTNSPPVINILKVSEPKVEYVEPSGKEQPLKQDELLDTIDGNIKIKKLKAQPIFDYDQLHKSVRGISRSPDNEEKPTTVDR